MMARIPVIDFSAYSLEKSQESVSEEDLQGIKRDIYEALSTVGFLYLKNHGFPTEKVEDLMSVSRKFFELSVEEKEKYKKLDDYEHGWVKIGGEHLDENLAACNKESMNYIPFVESTWTSEELLHIKQSFKDFYKDGAELSLRILDVISLAFQNDKLGSYNFQGCPTDLSERIRCQQTVGLGVFQARDFLRKKHSELKTPLSKMSLRSLYYPPVIKGVNELQPPCGEHSDYGSITLLWQDDRGGLQVRTSDDKYLDVSPIPGTIVVNIGDLLQRWTADKLVATRHRVVHPPNSLEVPRPRQSIALFAGPDNDTVIKCLDGSDKYEPITTEDYFKLRFSETY